MPHYPDEIEYSEKYSDDEYEYRHVILPKALAKKLYATYGSGNKGNTSKTVLLSEEQWRGLGVQQSRGWVHYECHRPEPHILLFRRPLGTNPLTGLVEEPQQIQQQQQPQQGGPSQHMQQQGGPQNQIGPVGPAGDVSHGMDQNAEMGVVPPNM